MSSVMVCLAAAAAVALWSGAGVVNGDNFLLLHPWYSGSHVLTLHAVTERLISRGHQVTTVR